MLRSRVHERSVWLLYLLVPTWHQHGAWVRCAARHVIRHECFRHRIPGVNWRPGSELEAQFNSPFGVRFQVVDSPFARTGSSNKLKSSTIIINSLCLDPSGSLALGESYWEVESPEAPGEAFQSDSPWWLVEIDGWEPQIQRDMPDTPCAVVFFCKRSKHHQRETSFVMEQSTSR